MADKTGPEPAYPGYLSALAKRLRREAERAEPPSSPYQGAPGVVGDTVTGRVEALGEGLVALSHDLHAHPELAYEERHAARAVARMVEGNGLDVDVGAYGLDTAVRATAGTGRPRVAVLAEYDALPGIGHACGHNVICATAVGAFLSLSAVVGDTGGSVELIGTPGEEGGGGKELIARAGGFEEVDAAVMLHPFGFDIAEHDWLGGRLVDVEYHGLAAHAAAMPFLGRNALDALVTAYTSIAQLRQHMLPTDRVHGVITDGGSKPNIVPEHAAAQFFVRSMEPETLAILCDRVADVFTAAARATGTVVDIRWDPAPTYLPMRNNATLAARYATNLAGRGRRVLPRGVVPSGFTGSTDLGNVSVRLPAIHPTLAISPPDVTIHTVEFARWSRSERADEGVVDGAVGLALTATDYLADAALRGAVADEFERAGGPLDVDALLG